MAALYISLTATLFALCAFLSAAATVAHDDQAVRIAFLVLALLFGLLAYTGFRL